MKLDKKAIKEIVINSLNAGKTKEEIYYEITSDNKYFLVRKEIANIIRFVPEKDKIKKYGIYNILFLIFLIIIDLINLMILNIGGLIWFGALTYIVATRQTKYYYWIAILGGVIFISGFFLTFYDYLTNGMNPITLIVGSTIIATIFVSFGVLFPKYLTPDFSMKDELVFDADGKKRMKKRIQYN